MTRFSLPLVAALAAVAAACSGDTAAAPERTVPPVRIAEPGALALDSRGGLLVADRKLNRVVRIDLRTGRRRLVATRLRDIVALAFDDMGRLYVGAGDRILRLDGARRTVIAGTGRRGRTGDGGPATAATIGGLGGFEVDHDETVTIAEYDNGIRFVDETGTISTIAGTGEEGYAGDGGPARAALLRHPHDLALRIDREVIVADSHNRVLRRIAPDGRISTFADGFSSPIAVKGGPGQHALRRRRRRRSDRPALARRPHAHGRRPRERADQPRGRPDRRVRVGDRRCAAGAADRRRPHARPRPVTVSPARRPASPRAGAAAASAR